MSGCHVYRCYDADGALLYVGISNDRAARLGAHRKADWWPAVATVAFEAHDSREAALWAEYHAIHDESPRHNVKSEPPVDKSMAHDEVATQLRDELGDAATNLAPLLGPDLGVRVESELEMRAKVLAAQLVQADDDRLAAQTVVDVMCALWPHGTPEDCGRAEWWASPLGRMCARSLGRDDSDAVTYAVAAAMLGVVKGTVGTLVTRGKLDKHPDGGITRASVLMRLAAGDGRRMGLEFGGGQE